MITLYELIVEWDYLWANCWFGAMGLMSWRVGAWKLGKKYRSHVAWVKWLHGWNDLIIVLWRYNLSWPCFFINICHQSLNQWYFTCYPMLFGMGTHVLCKILSKNHYSPLPWIIRTPFELGTLSSLFLKKPCVEPWFFMPSNVKNVLRKLWLARACEGQGLAMWIQRGKGMVKNVHDSLRKHHKPATTLVLLMDYFGEVFLIWVIHNRKPPVFNSFFLH